MFKKISSSLLSHLHFLSAHVDMKIRDGPSINLLHALLCRAMASSLFPLSQGTFRHPTRLSVTGADFSAASYVAEYAEN